MSAPAPTRELLLLAQDALAADVCALWRLEPAGTGLELVDGVPADRQPRTITALAGVLGAVVRHGVEVRLAGDDRALRNDPAVAGAGALLAVPVRAAEGESVQGALLAARFDAAPFVDRETRALGALAAQLARSEAAARRLANADAREREREVFYAAVERLNRLTTPAEVLDALLADAARVAPAEAAAVVFVEERPDRPPLHRIARATGALAADEGRVWEDNAGLAASAVRLGAALPLHGRAAPGAVVLDAPGRLPDLLSVKVLPLRAGAEILGTLVVAARAADAYPDDLARRLEVLALQAGDALVRARLFASVERLATTDALTGLKNRRVLGEELDRLVAAGRRYGRPFSLLLGDVDHFKRVNDTHGHQAGDAVLRGIGAVLQGEARAVDLAARYGGEELALLMPETGRDGAVRTAERIRQRVAAMPSRAVAGSLSVTLSIGVSTYPEHGTTPEALLAAADAALYDAKRQGRNRVAAAADAVHRQRKPAAGG